ncbi:MAG: transposase, partial [Bacteroidales bacterium]
MSKKHRKFELEEKLQILQEGENHGVDGTCRKYQISCSLFYNWKNKSDRYGPDEFARQLGISRTSLYEL